MLMRIFLHFWVTECQPLPVADHELRSIARGHAPTWRHWKASILRVFEAIRPDLEKAWRLHESRIGNMSRLGQYVSSKRKAAALRNSDTAPAGRDAIQDHLCMRLIPKRAEATRPQAQQTATPAGKFTSGFREK